MELDRESLERIYRRWPQQNWTEQGQRRGSQWSVADYGLWMAGGFLLAAAGPEVFLRFEIESPFQVISWRHSLAESAFLLTLFLANFWLLDGYLSNQTRRDHKISPIFLIGRWLLLSVPLVRLWSLPLWRSLLEVAPARPPYAGKLPNPLRAPWGFHFDFFRSLISTISRAPTMLMTRPALLVFVFGGELLISGSLLSSLSAPPDGFQHRLLLLNCTRGLHLLAAMSIAVYSSHRLREPSLRSFQRLLLVLLPLSFLLPLPGPLFGIFTWGLVDLQDQCRSPLIRAAFDRRSRTASLASWSLLEHSLLREGRIPWWTQMWKPLVRNRLPEPGESERLFSSLCRVKTLLLLFDAAALSWLFAQFASLGIFDPLPALLLWPILVSAALGALLSFPRLWKTISRGTEDPIPTAAARHLAGGPLVLLAGWVLGASIEVGNAENLGWNLFGIAMLSFLLLVTSYTGMAMVAGTARSSDDVMTLYLILCLALLGLGLYLILDPEGTRALLPGFLHSLWLGPAGGVALALNARGWMIHPFHRTQNLAWRQRLTLSFMVLTLALPLGGLAAPIWITVRKRWWPKWMEAVFSELPVSSFSQQAPQPRPHQ